MRSNLPMQGWVMCALLALSIPTTAGAVRRDTMPHDGARALPTAAVSGTDRADEPQKTRWRDARGRPLPFKSDAEALQFLRTADVVSMTPLPIGITRPEKVLLERGGVRAHAIFRTHVRPSLPASLREQIGSPDAFKDSALSEAAAYELARLLGLPFVPPTVRRIIDNREGTLQLWIENADSARERMERGEKPAHADWWRGVTQTLTIFDNLLFNIDRHTGNLLIDADSTVWFIDHTRAFQPERTLRNPEDIVFAERRLWLRLQAVSDEEIVERLGPYVDGRDLMALLARRRRLVGHIEDLIAEHGEGAVLYEYSYDLAAWNAHHQGP